jgi:hypothetical protein
MELPPGTDVWATPAGKPPSGVSNLVDPPTNENIGLVTLPLFLVIVTIFMGMRLYVKLRLTKQRLWWDDCMYCRQGPLRMKTSADLCINSQ